MNHVDITTNELSGIFTNICDNRPLEDDYYMSLEQFPDCMYFYVDRAIPVNLNNKPTI